MPENKIKTIPNLRGDFQKSLVCFAEHLVVKNFEIFRQNLQHDSVYSSMEEVLMERTQWFVYVSGDSVMRFFTE